MNLRIHTQIKRWGLCCMWQEVHLYILDIIAPDCFINYQTSSMMHEHDKRMSEISLWDHFNVFESATCSSERQSCHHASWSDILIVIPSTMMSLQVHCGPYQRLWRRGSLSYIFWLSYFLMWQERLDYSSHHMMYATQKKSSRPSQRCRLLNINF
jgi:hypothetical protein